MEDALREEANRFALALMERLARVLPSGNLGFTSEATRTKDGRVLMTVASAHKGGIVMTIDEVPRLQLQIDIKLVISPNSLRATVYGSTFLVRAYDEPRPLFTVDYVRTAQANAPAAHYNFHFENDAIVTELMDAGRKKRGKHYRKAAQAGKQLQLRAVHFPVGGHRFRPCLEDVLDMLRLEFGIDVREDTAPSAIAEGRADFREMQLRAAVSDHPEAAAEELRAHGYIVEPPPQLKPLRLDRLHAI